MIIGIAGRIAAGKSSLAKHLSTVAIGRGLMPVIAPFAGPLREEVWSMFRQGLMLVCGDDVTAACYRQAFESTKSLDDMYAKPTPPALRRVLQHYGTEFRRAQDPAYWVKKFKTAHGEHLSNESAVLLVDDVRFPNECDFIRANSGLVVWLDRKGVQDTHVSEALIGPQQCDVRIDNNCNLNELLASGEEAFTVWLERRGVTNGATA